MLRLASPDLSIRRTCKNRALFSGNQQRRIHEYLLVSLQVVYALKRQLVFLTQSTLQLGG